MFEYTPVPCGAERVHRDLIADDSDADKLAWSLYVESEHWDPKTGAQIQGTHPVFATSLGFNSHERYTLDEAIERYNALDEEAIAGLLIPGERHHVLYLSSEEPPEYDIVPVKTLIHIDDEMKVENVACEYQFKTYVRTGTPGIQRPDRPSSDQVHEARTLFFEAAAYLQGKEVDQDVRRGIELMEHAAKMGDALAQYNLYRFYLGPERDRHTQEEALALLELAASQDMPDAVAELGDVNACGNLGKDVDLNRALSCYMRAVSLGKWSAIPGCAALLLKAGADLQDAMQLYKLGARKGDAACQEFLDSIDE